MRPPASNTLAPTRCPAASAGADRRRDGQPRRLGWLALCFPLLAPLTAGAAETLVAVASNFASPAQEIAAEFNRRSGHIARLSSGATGKLQAQIVNGGPFEVLLSADTATPERLIAEGHGIAASRFTYAVGALALWSASPAGVDAAGEVLRRGDFKRLAVANPKTAPYGTAAQEVLTRLGLFERLRPRLVQGENIAQTYQFASTGNADLAFVALSQVVKDGKLSGGSVWRVPAALHSPLRQDALLLAKGRDKPAARAFLDFMTTPYAHAVITRYGYTTP